MKPIGEQNFYEIFDISPRATRQQIDQAYQLAKRTYADESLAAYSLFDAQERKEILERMQLAYQTLSDEGQRRQYDQEVLGLMRNPALPPPIKTGWVGAGLNEAPRPSQAVPQPEGPSEPEASIRIPLSSSAGRTEPEASGSGQPVAEKVENAPAAMAGPSISPEKAVPAAGVPPAAPVPEPLPSKPDLPDISTLTGASLKEFRELRKVPLQEIANKTRVNITYFDFMEKERYKSLPPPVYLRSYVMQYCQVLGLDGIRVAERILWLG
ncbi:MAG TPA: helix-turn-helix domain-containing protein, partial [Nitrospiria bacterium]